MNLRMHTSLCLFLLIRIVGIDGDIIELQDGVINGLVGKSKGGRLFQQFYGIPYAEPPVGELRFKAPVAVKPWSGIRDGSKRPPICIQPILFQPGSQLSGQEDCLYLNVFVPNDLFKSTRKTPVIVGIHGGAYKVGNGNEYSPDYFMDRDVIFVTLNYRLGALGFFGMNNDVISGNFGLKDQLLALQWIKKNIPRFGGDPNSVTLVGESAGAVSIHLHMFSPLSKGLFHKAIMQSGTAFSLWSHHNEGLAEASATAMLVLSGCFRTNATKILKCLQRIPAEEFQDLEIKLRGSNEEIFLIFKPIIESNVKNQPFLPHKPSDSTYQTNVPWIAGINSGEGALRLMLNMKKKTSLTKITNDDKNRLYSWISYDHWYVDEFDNDNTLQKIIDVYFHPNDTTSDDPVLKLVQMSTDSDFTHSLIKTALSSHDRQYVYLYDHKGSFSWKNFLNLTLNLGPSHSDELPLLFRDEKLEAKWTPEDKKVSETLLRFWINFATFGDPNGQSGEKIWTPVVTDDIEYLRIKSDILVMEKKLLKDIFNFWESLPEGFRYF